MKLFCLIITLLAFNFSWINAQVNFTELSDPETFIKAMRSAAKDTRSLTSDFRQIKHLDVLSEAAISTGRLIYREDSKLRWEYLSPFKYLIIMKDGQLYINDDGKSKTYNLNKNKTLSKINELITRSIKGELFEKDKAYSQQFMENNKSYLVILSPQDQKTKQFMKEIHLTVSKKTMNVASFKMIEKSGDFTQMIFNNKKINAPVPDDLFLAE